MKQYPLLMLKNIVKSFYHVEVLKGVDLEIKKGEVHALLGENGAGKSTLMNILGGVFPADKGEIWLNGEKQLFSSPKKSQDSGIHFIHQELNVINDLKVYENIFLGRELRTAAGFLDVKRMCKKTEQLLGSLGVHVHPKAYVSELNASIKQAIEIARSLLYESQLIIMDEPTTSLTDYEISHLKDIIVSLKKQNVSIIYISHKLKEVLDICDSYTVLRDGYVSGSGKITGTNEEMLTKLMIGKEIASEHYDVEHPIGETVLQVKDFTLKPYFQNISFQLKKGEVLGITGLAGDGRTELAESIFGYLRKDNGELFLYGQKLEIHHPLDALKNGIGLLPKNRKENGIIPDLTVIENFSLTTLKQFSKNGMIRREMEYQRFLEYQTSLKIRVDQPKQSIAYLSGGNQQKVLLAKWLAAGLDILILDNPTQGIDVGAKTEIYDLISRLSQQGKSLIVLSSESPELIKICDRIIVLFQGEFAGELDRKQATEEAIMRLATGLEKGALIT
ncbi:sugar ABC transporter ATP-binding protein [Bacillaceae bacterium Marseille-Q3522]|nr:sugar ABC transporter ATP-binding protein [Bacillaceae bacterium Marseille-Q3522]